MAEIIGVRFKEVGKVYYFDPLDNKLNIGDRVIVVRKFTAGFFMQMAETFSFVENENFIHKGIVCDGNVITGIGMFFREFAETVLHKFGYDVGSNFMRDNPEDYTEEELTFYWSEEDYRQFLKELKEYEK